MATSQEIINDLRAQARALDGRHKQGTMTDQLCRSLRRGADEIDRLQDELAYLRGFAAAALDAEMPR